MFTIFFLQNVNKMSTNISKKYLQIFQKNLKKYLNNIIKRL